MEEPIIMEQDFGHGPTNVVVVKEVLEEIPEDIEQKVGQHLHYEDESEKNDQQNFAEAEKNNPDSDLYTTSEIKTENSQLFEEATYAIFSASQALEHAQEAVDKIKNLVNEIISIEGINDPLTLALQCCRDAATAVEGASTVWQEIHRQEIQPTTEFDQVYTSNQEVKVKSEEHESDHDNFDSKEDFLHEEHQMDVNDDDDPDIKATIKRSLKSEKPAVEKKKYLCSECDYVATKKVTLSKHLQVIHEIEMKVAPKKHICEKCPFSCNTDKSIRKHALAKHKMKLNKCIHCGKMFSGKDDLEAHMKESHKDKPASSKKSRENTGGRLSYNALFKYIKEVDSMWECMLCDYAHQDHYATRKHVRRHHLSNAVFKCDKCEYVAKDQCHLKEHVSAKHEGITFPCPWEGCTHVSSQKRNLKKHVDVIHRRIEHTCKECNFKTRHPELLKKHMNMKHLTEKYFCDECTYAAPTLVSLNTHKGKAHPPGEAGRMKDKQALDTHGIIHEIDENGVRMYKCGNCDYTTNHLNRLKHKHMKKHTGEVLQCDHCPYTTWSKSALNTHMKARHEEHKYRCDQCDFTSSLGFQFRRHYESKHEGTVYKCDKCEFTAIRPEYLKKHMRKHEGKAFKCEFEGCSFVGPYASDLKVHIDAVHKGIRHKCTECDFTSGRKGDLNKHMKKVHGSEGHKFRCLRCPFATSHEPELLNHIKTCTKVVHDPEIAVLIMDQEIKLNMGVGAMH